MQPKQVSNVHAGVATSLVSRRRPVNGGSHKQVTSMGGVQIAVVDASKISLAREGAPEPEDFSEVAKELCSAFQETGFAYLVNHGVDLHLVQQVEGNLYILV